MNIEHDKLFKHVITDEGLQAIMCMLIFFIMFSMVRK